MREAEVGAEGVQEATAVADAVARDGLVRVTKACEVQCVDRETLRETSHEPSPNSGGSEPAMHQHDRRRSEEHTSELQSRQYLVCRLLLEKKKTQDILD